MAFDRYAKSKTVRKVHSLDLDNQTEEASGMSKVLSDLDTYISSNTSGKRVLPVSGNRANELHPSSFPYCALWHVHDIFSNGGIPTTQEIDYFGQYYTGLGTFKHGLMQDWLGKGKQLIGNWTCVNSKRSKNPCKGESKFSVYSDCPECGSEMEYHELGIKFGKYTHGHLDGIFLHKRKYYIVDYKGLALDTPIPTPNGWTTMGKIKVGDTLFGSDGKPCTVVSKSSIHKRKCYKITFDDTSSVVCDDEHLWVTYPGQRKTTPKVMSTEEIKDTLFTSSGQRQHRVMLTKPLVLKKRNLPIDPYLLGCWLGDGTAANGDISKPDKGIFKNIKELGYEVGIDKNRNNHRCATRRIKGLTKLLRENNLLKNKHIPKEYLRSSIEQRTELLRGLMDTDGSWNKVRRQAVFCTTDRKMAEDFLDLACGLGQRALINTVQATGFGKTVTAYQVTFVPVSGFIPFKTKVKRDRVTSGVMRGIYSSQRIIVSVDEIPAVKTQCLTVDSADRTYLCTRNMIPTHNTTGEYKLFQHKSGRKVEFPLAYNKAQIESYCYYVSKIYNIEVSGWILIYVSRDKSFRNYVSVGELITPESRKRISKTVKRYDKHFGIAIAAKSVDDIDTLIQEKPCQCREDYLTQFHNEYKPCPLAKNNVCFKPKALKDNLVKLSANMKRRSK